MKRIILSIALLLLSTAYSVYSQSITNVQAIVEGNTVVVSYQLQSSHPVEISLYVSEDGGTTFSGPLKSVKGDVGYVIQEGSKRILWDVLNDRELLHSSNLVFRVKAVSCIGTFCDPRDGKTYKTVKIDNQVWMAENLAFKPDNGNYWAYDNNDSNVAKYGYLYDWQTAKNVCPTGWHLPSDAEWTQLIDFVGSNPGTKLKAKSGWSNYGNGTDEFGFSTQPGGARYKFGAFDSIGLYGYWWSSTDDNTNRACFRYMTYSNSDVGKDYGLKSWGFSVRCVKDL